MSATQTEWTTPPQPDGLTLVTPSRSLPAGEGWAWIARGWRLFTRAPLMWILSMLIVFVAAVVMNFIPIIGGIVFQALNAVIVAGFVVACRSPSRRRTPPIARSSPTMRRRPRRPRRSPRRGGRGA
jgi:hypothetical protein